MDYSVSRLSTIAECDLAITTATDLKDELEFEQLLLGRESTTRSRSAIQLDADLASTVAQIDAFEAARDAVTDPAERAVFESRIRRLNDRKDNLEERKAKTGNNALLSNELERSRNEKQIAEIDVYINAVTVRKGEL